MEKIKQLPQKGVIINLPVRIRYSAFDAFLKENYIGEEIQEERNGKIVNYAEILDVALEESLEEGYDLAFYLEFKILTTLFRNKEGRILLHASLDFDDTEQLVSVKDFKVKGNSKSWLMNNTIEAIANTFVHSRLKNKMKLDIKSEIVKQLKLVNRKLEDQVEVFEGIYVSGLMDSIKITEILPGPTQFLVLINLEGNAVLDVEKIKFKT